MQKFTVDAEITIRANEITLVTDSTLAELMQFEVRDAFRSLFEDERDDLDADFVCDIVQNFIDEQTALKIDVLDVFFARDEFIYAIRSHETHLATLYLLVRESAMNRAK